MTAANKTQLNKTITFRDKEQKKTLLIQAIHHDMNLKIYIEYVLGLLEKGKVKV